MAGACNVITGGTVDTSEYNIRTVGRYMEDNYESGEDTHLAKEPFALVTRQDDAVFSGLVFWVQQAILHAEEAGLTKASARSMPSCLVFGSSYSRILSDVLAAVGNFREVYKHAEIEDGGNTTTLLLARTGLNQLNTPPYGPQHYPYPGLQ